jgi:hypothetical protein
MGKGCCGKKEGRRYLASIFYGYTLKTKYKNPTIIIIIIIFSLLTKKKKNPPKSFHSQFFLFKNFSFGQNFTLFNIKKKTGFSPYQLQGSSRRNGPYWATAQICPEQR